MSDTNLQRAVAIQALVGEVAARRHEGESDASIRADLLAEGLPPEVIDHAFAMTESARPRGRWRTVVAFSLIVALILGLPLAGAVGGAWCAYRLAGQKQAQVQEPEPGSEEEPPKGGCCSPEGLVRFFLSGVFGLVGAGMGFGIGLALAFPAVKAISAWSIQEPFADEVYS